MKKNVFKGCATAIITPFKTDGVDYTALKKLVNFQIAEGIDAIVVCGTTGEASTLSHSEKMQTIETVLTEANGKIPIIAGTGSNNTEAALALSRDEIGRAHV